MYLADINKIKAELETIDFIACTGDFWTSIANQAYMGITAHYVTEEFEPKQVLLAFKPFPEDKTGMNIRSAFLAVLNEYCSFGFIQ